MCVNPKLSERRRWRRKQHIRIHKQNPSGAPRSREKDGRVVPAAKAVEIDISTGLADHYHDDGESLVGTDIGEPSDGIIAFSIPPDQPRSVIAERLDTVFNDPLEGVSQEILELVGEVSPLNEFCPGGLPRGYFLEGDQHLPSKTGAARMYQRETLRHALESIEPDFNSPEYIYAGL